ncbi:hypothetical protein NUSPORA_01587 [Nucleospora cyclopteri]
MSKTPEETAPAEIYYNLTEAQKYHFNSRINKIQRELTIRALELLEINNEENGIVFIDIGSGSGISSRVLEENNLMHVGVDLSLEMLKIHQRNSLNSNNSHSKHAESSLLELFSLDIGNDMPFKEGTFDYAISISVIQWLFQSYKREHIPSVRIKNFFQSLYRIINKKAVLQFYCNKREVEILMKYSRAAGFTGGLQIDNEGTKNQKYYLILDKNGNKSCRKHNKKDINEIKRKKRKHLHKRKNK